MFWRMLMIAATCFVLVQPAAAQIYDPQLGQRPFWEEQSQRPKSGGAVWSGFAFPDTKPPKALGGPALVHGGPRPDIAPQLPETVSFPNDYGTGTIVIDTAGRRLYYVTSSTEAYRYPISVGRLGFTWTGEQSISRKAAWPDWHPPAEMRERDTRLPKKMTGGLRNPLGAMALYLGNTLYRIHGTNDEKSLGRAASSGCFRMKNAHVLHLAGLVEPGTKVIVRKRLPASQTGAVAAFGDPGSGGSLDPA